jgi:hypothetical protein
MKYTIKDKIAALLRFRKDVINTANWINNNKPISDNTRSVDDTIAYLRKKNININYKVM